MLTVLRRADGIWKYLGFHIIEEERIENVCPHCQGRTWSNFPASTPRGVVDINLCTACGNTYDPRVYTRFIGKLVDKN